MKPNTDAGRWVASVVLAVATVGFVAGDARAAPAAGHGKGDKSDKSDKSDDLSRARALDKEGARAYAEGRYADAIRNFEEAFRLGGPAFELWNVAKCHLRLDQPEQAATMLERYLATPNLPKEDRDEATQQLDAVKKRTSTLLVTSTPAGAQVTIDGKAVEGRTPVSMTVSPGSHTVTISSPAVAPTTKQVEAKYGRPIIVDAATVTETRPPPPANPYDVGETHPLDLRGALGIAIPRYGTVGPSVAPNFLALLTYRLVELPSDLERRRAGEGGPALAVGGLLSIAADSWDNRTGSPNTPPPSCVNALRSPQSATALSVFGVGAASFPVASKLRAQAIGGVGLAGYFVSDVGGDLFVPSCTTSPGVRPALLLGTQLDYALTNTVRLSAFPLTWQVQPAFTGTRASPRDASGVWMRFGIAIGAGVDL